MSDNQRRFFCRLLFLFFCCLPTAIVVYRATHPQTPEFWQRSIQAQLGIETQIADIETPTPNEMVLRGMTLLGADGRPVLSAIETRLQFGEDANVITIKERVQLTARGLTELADRMNERMVRSGNWSVRLEDVVVVGDTLKDGRVQTVVLSPVEISIASDGGLNDAASDAIVSMRVNHFGESDNALVQCRFRCFDDPTRTTVLVETSDSAVPCWLLKGWLPQLAELGPHATFQGGFGVDPMDSGRVLGRFERVAIPADMEPQLLSGERVAYSSNEFCAMEVDMSFHAQRRHSINEEPLHIAATLELPDGSKHQMVPEYQFHQVLEVGSAIGKTVRTARSRSASNYR